MSSNELVIRSVPELKEAIAAGIKELDSEAIQKAAGLVKDALIGGGNVYLLGNGEASAISALVWINLMHAFTEKSIAMAGRPINLTDNLELYGSFYEKYGFEYAFQKMLEAYLQPSDVVMAISADGISGVENALRYAKAIGATTILLSGPDSGEARAVSDITFISPFVTFASPDWYRDYSLNINMATATLICAEVNNNLGGIDATGLFRITPNI